MGKKEDYESIAQELVTDIIEELGLELVDVEYVKEGSDFYLRYYIDKEGGVTIDDCEAVSRRVSDRLDEKDPIKDPYILEVSSPGLGRQLKKDRDFHRSIGQDVDVKLFKQVDGQKEFTGKLTAFDTESVTIALEKSELALERSNIAKISLTIDF